jgi:tetratricopeptide (TPR) repeat protein
LDFDNDLLKQAESEIVLLFQSGQLSGVFLGIDLENLGKDGYLWPFQEIPSRQNKDDYSFLADMEKSTVAKIKCQTHFQAARIFESIESLDLAIKHYEIAERLGPPMLALATSVLLASVYGKLYDADKALTQLKRAARIDEKDPNIHYLMASFYAWKSDFNSAFLELENAVERGFNDIDGVVEEPNFKPILSDPRMKIIIEKMKSVDPKLNVDVF